MFNEAPIHEKYIAVKFQDPLILSCVLSCVSTLFPFINEAPDVLPLVLNKVNDQASLTYYVLSLGHIPVHNIL